MSIYRECQLVHEQAGRLLPCLSRDAVVSQVAAQPRLSHEVLRKHTEMNEQHSSNAALVEQIQALTATHQQLAQQIQALVQVFADHHVATPGSDLRFTSTFVFAAAVAFSLILGIVVAKLLP